MNAEDGPGQTFIEDLFCRAAPAPTSPNGASRGWAKTSETALAAMTRRGRLGLQGKVPTPD